MYAAYKFGKASAYVPQPVTLLLFRAGCVDATFFSSLRVSFLLFKEIVSVCVLGCWAVESVFRLNF